RSPSPYNDIIGRPGIREIQAVPSTAYGMLKFPVDGGVVTIHSTILTPNECATITATSKDSMKKTEGGQKKLKKKRGQAPERAKAIQAELENVRGLHESKQGMPAGLLPLWEIDWKVESLCDYPFKCFLEAYKGYHQIQMAELDEEKMDFYTPHGVYCYTKMPFGLKNARATYQRLVDKAFEKQVGRNLEVYVDDLVIKSHTEAELLRDIEETFHTTPHVGGTKSKGRANNVLIRLPMSGWRCLDDKKGLNPDASLFFITDQPIRQVMSRPEVVGRLQKWSIMLGEHNITYRPRTSVKGQILADFLVEKPEEASADMSEKEAPQEPWTLFTNGSSCIDGSGAGLILTSLDGVEFTYALRFQFTASNNEAEYEALLAGLRIATQMRVRNVRVSVDSKLVADQVLGTYIAKEENMIKYLEK
ncbi:reverse transcriptase domain-containing protein, partial [Tanacetum coccineum]